MPAPNRARLTEGEIYMALRTASTRDTNIINRRTADKAWDTCRAEALEAASGLVAIVDDVIASVEEGLAETNNLTAVKAAKADWVAFLEGN